MLTLRDVWIGRFLGWFGLRIVRNMLLYTVVVVIVSAAIYAVFEGQEVDYLDGLWWAVVTLTTVGYGDISPASVGMRIVAVWVMASGLISVAVITGVIASRMSVAALAAKDETPGIEDDFGILAADLADATDRVRHLQERFRTDERGDDRVCAAARVVCDEFHGGRLTPAAVDRLSAAVEAQQATDA